MHSSSKAGPGVYIRADFGLLAGMNAVGRAMRIELVSLEYMVELRAESLVTLEAARGTERAVSTR